MLLELLKSIDYGGYYFFRHLSQQVPELSAPMQLGYALGGLVPVGAVAVIAALLFLRQRRLAAAVIAAGACIVGVALVAVLQPLVAARRPEDAQDILGSAAMAESFPAGGVFLFTLAGTLLVVAAWGALRPAAARIVIAALTVILVLWVALSPLVLGLHFVTDVLGGLSGGLALALLATRFLPDGASSAP